MTYHEVAYECNHCGKVILDDWDWRWELEFYDRHYCGDCALKMKTEKMKEERRKRDIESGKIKIKKRKLPPKPKWCPKSKGKIIQCHFCGRMPDDCPYPDLGGKK